MKLALYQCPEPTSLDTGLATLHTALAEAAKAQVDMLVMPEAFLPGYTQVQSKPPDGWIGVRGRIAGLCKRHGIALTIGVPDFRASKVYNTAIAFSADGTELAHYDKRQLFGPAETAIYTPGHTDVLFEYQGTRFGVLICYDVEFPEHARALARQGADVILVPTANMMPYTNVNQIMIPSRAAENAVTVVYANYCGTAKTLTYAALSRIVGPDGYVLAGLDAGTGLCVADVPAADKLASRIPLSTQLSDYKRA